jgi:hypothetical protein
LVYKSAGLLFCTVGTVISGLHIAAWSWDFPSYTILILWRVFSVAATCSLLVLYLVISLLLVIDAVYEDVTFYGTNLFIWVIYIISRLGLIFLVFYCFSSMPAAVYETVDWNIIFPHFS